MKSKEHIHIIRAGTVGMAKFTALALISYVITDAKDTASHIQEYISSRSLVFSEKHTLHTGTTHYVTDITQNF